jgi:uncharacterized protein (DUF1501 family)
VRFLVSPIQIYLSFFLRLTCSATLPHRLLLGADGNLGLAWRLAARRAFDRASDPTSTVIDVAAGVDANDLMAIVTCS